MVDESKYGPDVLENMESLFEEKLESGELYEIEGLEGSELGERERKKMHNAAIKAIKETMDSMVKSAALGCKPEIDIESLEIPKWGE